MLIHEMLATPGLMLTEASGFSNRELGDIYHNPHDPSDLLEFRSMTPYPTNATAWPDAATAQKAWAKIRARLSGEVIEVNKPNAGLLSVMVVYMWDPATSEDFYFAKWTKDTTSMQGKFLNIPAGAREAEHPGYKFKKGASETYLLKPSDVLSSAGPYNVQRIISALNGITAEAAPADVTEQLQTAVSELSIHDWPITIPGGSKYAAFHSKYTNEWLAPIAVSQGKISAADVKKIQQGIAGGKSFRGAQIYYPVSGSETLIDSYIRRGDVNIQISSKAQGGGASASIKGIRDTVEKFRDRFDAGFFRKTKVKKFMDAIDSIMDRSAIDGVLHLAETLQIISANDAAILELQSNFETNPNRVQRLSKKTRDLMIDYPAATDNPNYKPYFHAVMAVAKAVCKQLNADNYTDQFREILNKADMVQCYLNTKVKGDDLVLTGMDVIYPAVFSGNIWFTAGKAYTSTAIKGRIGFKINATAADKNEDNEKTMGTAKSSKPTAPVKKLKARFEPEPDAAPARGKR